MREKAISEITLRKFIVLLEIIKECNRGFLTRLAACCKRKPLDAYPVLVFLKEIVHAPCFICLTSFSSPTVGKKFLIGK